MSGGCRGWRRESSTVSPELEADSGFRARQVVDADRQSIYNVDTVVVSGWRSMATRMEVCCEEPYSEVGQ